MKKTRFTEEQIAAILREQDAGSTVEEICRKHGFSNKTFCHWKKKFGSMEATDVKKIRQLEEENARLKRIVANLSLENEAENEVLRKSSEPATETRSSSSTERRRRKRTTSV